MGTEQVLVLNTAACFQIALRAAGSPLLAVLDTSNPRPLVLLLCDMGIF